MNASELVLIFSPSIMEYVSGYILIKAWPLSDNLQAKEFRNEVLRPLDLDLRCSSLDSRPFSHIRPGVESLNPCSVLHRLFTASFS